MSWWEVKNFLHLEVAAAVVTSFLRFKEISPSLTNCGNLNWIIISWCYYWISRQEKCNRDFFCSCYADQYLHRMEAVCAHGSIKKFQGSKEGMCLQQLWETSWVLWGKKAQRQRDTVILGREIGGAKTHGCMNWKLDFKAACLDSGDPWKHEGGWRAKVGSSEPSENQVKTWFTKS